MRQLRRRRDAGDSTSDVDDLHHTRAPPRNAPQQFRCRWLWQLVTRDGPNEFRCSYTAMNGSLGASARGRLLCSCFRSQRQSPCTPARLERDVASARSCRGRPSRRWFANPLFARLASRSSVRAEEVRRRGRLVCGAAMADSLRLKIRANAGAEVGLEPPRSCDRQPLKLRRMEADRSRPR